MITPSLLQRHGTTTTAILGAVALGLVATDFRAIAEEKREPGIAGISKGRPALTVPADVPDGETRWYGVGFAFQVGPGLAGLLCNRHIDDAGDHEDGSDLILFDKLGRIKAENAIAVSRNETRVNPKTGQGEVATKFTMRGGFVPRGARRPDGSPHPHAGSGFGMCEVYIRHATGGILRKSLQLQQFSFDGRKFHTFAKTPTWNPSKLKVAGSDWVIEMPGLSMAIPDGDDLLFPAVARNGTVLASGVSRWRCDEEGHWKPVAFLRVMKAGMEPTLSRDVDGSLLFCMRGAGSSGEFPAERPNAIRVWRSTDNGRTWKVIVDEPDLVGFNPISINRALDGTPYVASNLMKEDRSYSREVLALWPLNKDRSGIVGRQIVRDGPREFGSPPTGRMWKLDCPTSATLQLGDRWHHVLLYRGKEDPTSRKPIPQAGSYMEEVTSTGPPLPPWNFPTVPPRSDGRVLHVDFENYADGVVQALNAGVRWLGDPFSGRKEGDVAITKANAWSGKRAARVATRESDEIGRVRLQARYDAPKIDGDSVNEFVFRGNGTVMDDFVLWSAKSADGRRAGVTLLAVAGDKPDTFAIDVVQAESTGSQDTKRTRGVVAAVDGGEWIRAILYRLRRERMVELWIGPPGKEQRIGKFNDLGAGAAAERIELGDTSTKTIRGGGDWDDVLVGGRLADGVEPAKAEPPLRNVSDEVAGIVTPIQLSRAKQLFLHDVVIESKKGLRREMHAVRKHGGNPLVTPDRPWEGRSVLLYGGVIRDPDTKQFRMWYLAWGKHIGQPSFICYAESSDGIRWEKPKLNLVQYKGSKANNIVLPGWSQTSVLRDPTDPDPARRYKALLRYKGLRGFTSPDGVHWKDVGPLIDQGFDSTTLHWDPVNKQWVAMVKVFKDGKRARGYATSKDFLNWTDTYFMSTVDERDGSGDQMYSMSMFHYETVYLGLLRMYHTDSDVVDIQLATSRNSKRWERPTREPFIPSGDAKGTWDFGNNSVPATPPIRVGDELWFYYAGRSTLHNEIPNDGAIGLATLRVDGFASMTADDQGVLTTKPLHSRGGQLCLNADASQGSIRVELLTDDGVLSSKPIQGDAVRHVVAWDTTKPIPRGDIRLRFHVDNAKLYSFWAE